MYASNLNINISGSFRQWLYYSEYFRHNISSAIRQSNSHPMPHPNATAVRSSAPVLARRYSQCGQRYERHGRVHELSNRA